MLSLISKSYMPCMIDTFFDRQVHIFLKNILVFPKYHSQIELLIKKIYIVPKNEEAHKFGKKYNVSLWFIIYKKMHIPGQENCPFPIKANNL